MLGIGLACTQNPLIYEIMPLIITLISSGFKFAQLEMSRSISLIYRYRFLIIIHRGRPLRSAQAL